GFILCGRRPFLDGNAPVEPLSEDPSDRSGNRLPLFVQGQMAPEKPGEAKADILRDRRTEKPKHMKPRPDAPSRAQQIRLRSRQKRQVMVLKRNISGLYSVKNILPPPLGAADNQ